MSLTLKTIVVLACMPVLILSSSPQALSAVSKATASSKGKAQAPVRYLGADTTLRQGYAHLQGGDYQGAVNSFILILRNEPNHVMARRYLAWTLLQMGNADGAISQIGYLEVLKAKTSFDSYLKATAYEALGDMKSAANWYVDAVNEDPDNDNYRMKAIDTLQGLARYTKAASMARNGAKYAPSDEWEAKYNKKLGQIQSAEKLSKATQDCRVETAAGDDNK